jgi:diadenylate cyclase
MNYILSYLENFAISDLFDIFFVAFILYRFLILLQGTRAVQMIIGLIVLSFVYWMSISYKLYSLNWVLNHFFEYFFIIVIVLFQDQIRNALISVGKVSWFIKSKSSLYEEQVEEVISCCKALSGERVGAIIVFEKSNGLMNYAETGTMLQSDIHSDILYSLFQNNSPLHDGAVIISDRKILAAGCFLPLAKDVDIDRHFGTRHRAALGITELTDAVVITVSEETGNMNLAYNGVFYAMEGAQSLRKYLRQFLMDDVRQAITELSAESSA